MHKYKIIFNKNGTSLEIMADKYVIEDNVVKFKDVGGYEPVAIFNMNNIIGIKRLRVV